MEQWSSKVPDKADLFISPRPVTDALTTAIFGLTARRDNELADLQLRAADRHQGIAPEELRQGSQRIKAWWREEIIKVCLASHGAGDEMVREAMRAAAEMVNRNVAPVIEKAPWEQE
jgi:K+-sensing histidine kinase KdpD